MTANELHEDYTAAVDQGDEWPSYPAVPLPDAFVNDAGRIQNLLLKPMQSVALITSKKGSVRANHLHRTDWHYAYVVSGAVLYFERAPGEEGIGRMVRFDAGTMFFTPPGVEHAMLFAEDSVILTFAKNVRKHEEHEADLVRVTYITPEIAAEFVR